MSGAPGRTPIRLGFLSFELPGDWEHEIELKSRAPATAQGYRPNVRLTFRTAAEPVTLEVLAREYQARLKDGMDGATVEPVRSQRRKIGAEDALELAFRVQLAPGQHAHHQVLLAARGRSVVTVATSRREQGEDPALADALVRVLASLSST